MSLFEIIFLAIALGVDCLVVSFSQGLLIKCQRRKISNLLASIMGIFQGVMPLISYLLTGVVYDYISPFAKMLVFGIFMFLGLKFVIEVFGAEKDTQENVSLGYKVLIFLGIATSIDALGAGISLKLTNTGLLLSCGIIAATSYLMSLCGFWGGAWLKIFDKKYLEILAGMILIFLAIKALF